MRVALLALLVFAVALLVRVPGIGDRSYWLDEASTLEAALAPDFPALFEQVERVEIGKGPIYYLLLRGWVSVFGDSEAAVRWPSALFGSIAAAMAFLWAALLWGRRRAPALLPGLLAGAVMALHPLLFALSRDARSYTLSHAFLFAAGALMVPAYLGESRRITLRFLAVMLAALGVSVHLFSGFFVFGLYLAVAVARWPDRGTIRRLAIDGAVLFALLLIQLPLTLRQASLHFGLSAPAASLTFRDIAHYLLGALGRPVVFVLIVLVPVSLWRSRREAAVRYCMVLLVAPLAAVLGTHFLLKPVLIGGDRYLAWAAAPVALLATGVVRAPRHAVFAFVVVAALVVGNINARDYEECHAENWRAVAEVLDAQVREGDRIVCHAHYVRQPLAVYYAGEIGPRVPETIEREGRKVPDPAPLRAVIDAGKRVFLIWSHAGEFDAGLQRFYEAILDRSSLLFSEGAIQVLRFG